MFWNIIKLCVKFFYTKPGHKEPLKLSVNDVYENYQFMNIKKQKFITKSVFLNKTLWILLEEDLKRHVSYDISRSQALVKKKIADSFIAIITIY